MDSLFEIPPGGDEATPGEVEQAKPFDEKTFVERTLCQFGLPYRDPGPDVSEWKRRNGRLHLTVNPYYDNLNRVHWAYGVYPRLLLMWITEQVVRGGEGVDPAARRVYFNDSLRGFLEDLGVACNGKDAKRVQEQLRALAGSRFLRVEEVETDEVSGVGILNTVVAERAELLWSRHDPEHTDPLVGRSYIQLSEGFWRSIKDHPVPLERGVVRALRTRGGGGLALDVYDWLEMRLYLAQKRHERFPLRIGWENLREQFGSDYKELRNFKPKFLAQLKAVQAEWFKFTYRSLKTHIEIRPILDLEDSASAPTVAV